METCSIDGCDRTHYAKTLCQMHYARKWRTGHVGPAHLIDRNGMALRNRAEYIGEVGTCVCGTEFRQRSVGSRRRFCSKRCANRVFARQRRADGYTRPPRPPCVIDGCDKMQEARGWCVMHLERVKKSGTPGEAAPRKAKSGEGVWRITRDGYLRRNRNGAPELQHRVVMEQSLGRPLWGDENVHHLNGDRSDNRIENLELWSKWQPGGQRVADKIAFAREILARYADLPREVL